MYLKEIKDKDTFDVLKTCSCMNCGILPKFKSELQSDGVLTTISFNDNPNWIFVVDKENQKMSDCYCPVCSRKVKLERIKNKI